MQVHVAGVGRFRFGARCGLGVLGTVAIDGPPAFNIVTFMVIGGSLGALGALLGTATILVVAGGETTTKDTKSTKKSENETLVAFFQSGDVKVDQQSYLRARRSFCFGS